MINNKSIGKKLKELRNSRDLKQSELAEHELKKGSERIKAVFEYKIAQGQPITGNVPLATISSVTSETKDTTEKELKELRKELDNLNYIFIKKRMPVSTYERLYAETEDKIKRLESFKP